MASSYLHKTFKKWLYGSCPGFAGAFPYFRSKVYFPKGSPLFTMACEQGIFEGDNVRLLQARHVPDSVMFDIGANIGLMSLSMLGGRPSCRVVAFEPSPNVLPFLQRTLAESPYRDRWSLVPKAVSDRPGRLTFNLSSPENSVYDGIQNTHRAKSVRQVEVEVTTVDETWEGLGRPHVSVIKCDVEGAEIGMLNGALQCLKTSRPAVLLEWNRNNLAAYQCPPESLLNFAREINYQLYSVPNLVEIHTPRQLTVQMCLTESFLLHPNETA